MRHLRKLPDVIGLFVRPDAAAGDAGSTHAWAEVYFPGDCGVAKPLLPETCYDRRQEDAMRRDSFERFYYEKVSLEGCGCAEYVSTRLRDLDRLAVKAEARGIAWSAPESLQVWVRLADRIRKLAERANWRPQPRFMFPRWSPAAELFAGCHRRG